MKEERFTWTVTEVYKLIQMGRDGDRWEDIANYFKIPIETARAKFNQIASKDDRLHRADRYFARRRSMTDHIVVERTGRRRFLPPGVMFSDDPKAVAPDYGRATLSATFVPTGSSMDY